MFSFFVACAINLNVKWAKGLGTVASFSARKPWTTIAGFFLICGIFLAGVVRISFESRTIKLFVDQDSEAKKHFDFFEQTFSVDLLFAQIVAVGENVAPGNNIITKVAFDDLFALHQSILDLSSTVGGARFDQICIRTPNGNCLAIGALQYWNFDFAQYNATITNDTDVQLVCAQELFPDGTEVETSELFGEYQIVNGLASARAVAVSYAVGLGREVAVSWATDCIDLSVNKLEPNELEYFGFSDPLLDSELNRSIFNDILLLGIAYVLMIAFLCSTLGKPCSRLHGRVLISVANTIFLFVATGSAYGLMMWFGIPFTVLSQLGLFILLGIGIDNAYVISGAFDATDSDQMLETRFQEAMSSAGMSITATALSDCLALFLGSLTRIPGIRFFCFYTGTAILFIYIQHVTVFVALLALDSRRRKASRRDVIPCIHTTAVVQENKDRQQESLGARFFYNIYGPFLLHKAVRVTVVLFFVGMAGLAGYGATKITTNFENVDLVPDDSFIKSYFLKNRDVFGDDFPFTPTSFLVVKDVDYKSQAVNEEISRLVDEIRNASVINSANRGLNWHRDFHLWARTTLTGIAANSSFTPDGRYYIGDDVIVRLEEFFQESFFEVYREDIVTTENNTVISATRIPFSHTRVPGSARQVDALELMEGIYQNSFLDPRPAIHNGFFPFWDQYRIIVSECIQNFGLCLAAIVIVSMMMLVSFQSVAILTTVMASTFLWLLASLPFWGLDLNSISYVNLVMAIGLVVDYSLHLIHAFGVQPSGIDRKERTLRALKNIGPAVSLGLFTTFLGVIPLAGASSEIFRVFFQMFLSIVTCGGIHGFILLPVLLS